MAVLIKYNVLSTGEVISVDATSEEKAARIAFNRLQDAQEVHLVSIYGQSSFVRDERGKVKAI